MKRKWRMFLTIIGLVILVGAGGIYYLLNIKEYETADKQVEEIINSEYDIQLPDKESTDLPIEEDTGSVAPTSSIIKNQPENESKTLTDNDQKAEKKHKVVSNNTVNENSNVASSNESVTSNPSEQSIITRYNPVLNELQTQAEDKLNNLLNYAFNEYKTKKANGENISYFYFYQKYYSSVTKLEANTDSSFRYIYNALESELVEAGYSTSNAESIKEQYDSIKKQRQDSVIAKAKNILAK